MTDNEMPEDPTSYKLDRLLTFELDGVSKEAAEIIMEVAAKNAHRSTPFSEENCGLKPEKVARLMQLAGLNMEVWVRDYPNPQGRNVAPVLFRNSKGDLGNPLSGESQQEYLDRTLETQMAEYSYYLLTPINDEDPNDFPQFNEPAFGRLLDEEEHTDLITEVFGAGGVSIEFGPGARLISDDTRETLIELLPQGMPSSDLAIPQIPPKPEGS